MKDPTVMRAWRLAESFFEPGGGPAGPTPEGFEPLRSLEKTPEALELLAALSFLREKFPNLHWTFKMTVRRELGGYTPTVEFLVGERLLDEEGEPTGAATPIAWGSVNGPKSMSPAFATAYSLALAEL